MRGFLERLWVLRRFFAMARPQRPRPVRRPRRLGRLAPVGRCPNGGAEYDDVNPNAAARFAFAHVCILCQATNAIWVPAGSVPAAPSSG